jgi:hypothetical protein
MDSRVSKDYVRVPMYPGLDCISEAKRFKNLIIVVRHPCPFSLPPL